MIAFLNIAALAGLAAVALPPLIHLFSRKKYDEVPWAAMQFLAVSQNTRRSVSFENWLLMLLRVLAVALLAAAVAAPTLTHSFLNRFAPQSADRDVVVLIDGSASMCYKHGNTAAADQAKDWARGFLGRLKTGDRVAVFQARQGVVPLVGQLTADRERALGSLDLLAAPKGGVDWPGCVQSAVGLLDAGGRPVRDVVIVTDTQRYGWADDATVAKWDLIKRDPLKPTDPRLWVVTVDKDRPAEPANVAIDPIVAGRAVATAGREVRFKSAVRFSGAGAKKAVPAVKFEIDGRFVQDLPAGTAEAGVVPLQFSHKFTAGSHLVTLRTPADDLPADDEQHFALEVLPSVPVLIVDGGGKPRPGEFLRDALAPAKDPTPAFAVKLITAGEFSAASFTADVKGPGTPPRVVVFAGVEKFAKDQTDGIEKYLADGGSVWLILNESCDAVAYNRVAFRGGQGWLPARLVEATGDVTALADAPKPQTAGFAHPALEVFKEQLPGGLHTAYFPRRWKVDSQAGANGSTGTVIAPLTNNDALLVERGVGRGRAVLCTVPLDSSWRSNLVTLPDFVRFAHEVAYYLAGAKAADRNLSPGQPIVFTPRPPEPPGTLTVRPPGAAAKPIPVKQWPAVFADTRDPGAYTVATAGGRTVYFAVRSDPNEAVLTPCSDDDRKRVAQAVNGLDYVDEPADVEAKRGDGPATREVWWIPLAVLFGLLFGELLYTRSLARRGNGPAK